MSQAFDLATAIAEALQEASDDDQFSMELTATAEWLPRRELSALTEEPIAVVVPVSAELENVGRKITRRMTRIDVAIQAKADTTDAEAIADLATLAEEVCKFLEHMNPESTGAAWVRAAHSPIFAREIADEFSAFTSVISAWYATTD